MTTSSTPRLACSLGPGDYADRLAAIDRLHRAHLRASAIDGCVLTLHFDAAAGPQVDNLVRLERACCQFLGFEVTSRDNGIVLRIEAPAEAGDGARHLLSPFTPRPADS